MTCVRLRVVVITLAVGVGAVAAGAAAQGLDDPLPRAVVVHAADVERPCDLSRTVDAIARATGVRAGVEQLPGCEPGGRAKRPIAGPPMAGRTARALFHELVQRRGEYQWREIDGVAVVLPLATWADPRHLLRRPVPEISVSELHPHLALHALLAAAGVLRPHEDARLGSAPFGPTNAAGLAQPVALTFGGGTLLEALNVLAARVGGHWELGYAGPVPQVTVLGARWEDGLFTVPLLAPPSGDRE